VQETSVGVRFQGDFHLPPESPDSVFIIDVFALSLDLDLPGQERQHIRRWGEGVIHLERDNPILLRRDCEHGLHVQLREWPLVTFLLPDSQEFQASCQAVESDFQAA